MNKKLSQKLKKKLDDMKWFAVPMLIGVLGSLRGLCQGSCTSCGLCVLVIPMTLVLSCLHAVKRRFSRVIARITVLSNKGTSSAFSEMQELTTARHRRKAHKS